MKNLASRRLLLLVVSGIILSALMFDMSRALQKNVNGGGKHTVAKLIVPRFSTTFQTRAGELIASSLPILIQIGLQAEKFKWLDVTSDTSLVASGREFLLAGSILDLSDGLNLDLHLIAIGDDRTKSEIKSMVYQIEMDSILIQIDKICKDIASVVQEQVSGREELYVVIYPFEGSHPDTTFTGVGGRIARSIAISIREMAIAVNAVLGDSRTNLESADKSRMLVIRGRYSLAGDSGQIVSTMTAGRSQKVIYTPAVSIDAYGVTRAARRLADALRPLLRVYQEVSDLLLTSESPDELFTRAELYRTNSEDPDSRVAAEVLYTRAIQLDNRYLPALLNLAEIQRADQRFDESIANFKQVLAVDSTQAQAYLGLSEGYSALSQDSLAMENIEIAVSLGKAQENASVLSHAYRRLGELNSLGRLYDSAIKYYRQALDLDKEDLRIWYGLGNAHYLRYAESTSQLEDTADIELAVEYFRQAALNFPSDSTLARNAAYLLTYWGKVYYDEYQQHPKDVYVPLAKQKFQQASIIRQYDTNLSAEILDHLAWLALLEGQVDQAKILSRRAVQFLPTDEWTYRLFAYCHKQDTAYSDQALWCVRKALSISANSYDYEILADVYITKNEIDSACAALRSLTENKGTLSTNIVRRLYNSAFDAGKVEQAEPALRDFLNQGLEKKDSVWVYTGLAEARRRRGDTKGSLREISRAIAVDPSALEVLSVLDSLFDRNSVTSSLDLKIAVLEKYLETQLDAQYLRDLAWTYALKKQYAKCDDLLGQAIKASKTAADTATAVYIEGRIGYMRAQEAYENSDSDRARPLMSQALLNFERVSAMYPKFEPALRALVSIYHDYIIDYEKAYEKAHTLLVLNDQDTSDVMNAIEAMLTAKRFDELDLLSRKILGENSLANVPLRPEYKLAVGFLLIASRVLRGDIVGAHSYYGPFEDEYNHPPILGEGKWNWTGSKRFLETYPDYKNPIHQDLLLSIIEALESRNVGGEEHLQKANATWDLLVATHNVSR